MAYISKNNILAAYKKLCQMHLDPNAQGATQKISAIRHFIALDCFYKLHSRDCNTREKHDRDEFARLVGLVCDVCPDLYTTNFYYPLKQHDGDYCVGSNFYSAGQVKASLVAPTTKFEYPKRGNTPLLRIKNGILKRDPSLYPNFIDYIADTEYAVALIIWIIRQISIDQNGNSLYKNIYKALSKIFTSELLQELFPSPEIFGKEMRKYNIIFYDTISPINESDIRNLFEQEDMVDKENIILTEPLQLICYGAPGTGKSHHIDGIIDDENAIRTTFHPDTDYAAFVGAYKPTMEPMPVYATVGIDLKHARDEYGEKAYEQKIIYKYVPQAFLKAYVAAWSNLKKPFYLIIEEINRGNCAQIFGDLFQLLDRNNTGCSSYPIHADEDIQRFLVSDAKGFASLEEEQKNAIRNFKLHKDNGKIISIGEQLLNGTKLLLPPNLHIWATMNTSDQSLFPIDSAFKRRWNWKYIPIDYNKESWTFAIGDQRYSWGDFLRKINPEIYSLTESADKQMGYYFVKADPQTGVISEDVFLNKVLFYLWTDVFKDYDISSDLFKNKEQNRPFRFSDFFEKDGVALENFIEGLGLEPIDEEETDTEEFLPDEDDDSSSRDMSKYSINGEGMYNKRQTVRHALELYIQNHPNLSDEEIIGNWQDLNSGHKNFMEIENVFNARTANNLSQKRRSGYVQRPNGSKIYIKNQWGGDIFDRFVHSFNQKDWGITIVKIKE